MDLFQKNIFSESRPRFHQMKASLSEDILGILSSNYPFLTITEVYSIGAFEINSNNWKIESNQGSFILKRSNKSKQHTLLNQAKLTSDIEQSGFPTLHFIKNKNEEYFSADEHYVYCLSVFRDGDYFGTDIRQWNTLIAALFNLWEHCSGIVINEYPDLPERLFFTEDENQLISFLRDFPKLNHTSKELISLVLKNYDELNFLYKSSSLKKGIFHVDIHPHNLVYDGDRLALLTDFESFQRTIPEISLGFGLYKCMRQLLVGIDIKNRVAIVNNMEGDFKKSFYALSLHHLLNLGKIDVLKRVLYILKELKEKGNSEWLFMLDTQLSSLKEIDELLKISKKH